MPQRRWTAENRNVTAATLKTAVNASIDRTHTAGSTAAQTNHVTGIKAAVAALVDNSPAAMRKFIRVHGETREDGTGRITINLTVSGDLPQ